MQIRTLLMKNWNQESKSNFRILKLLKKVIQRCAYGTNTRFFYFNKLLAKVILGVFYVLIINVSQIPFSTFARSLINSSSTFPKERVISIRTTDEAGIVSDSCEIELDDFDGALQFPNTEARVVVSLGYKETGLTKIGTYFVKEISIDGARHIVRIQCNAASKAMRSQKTKTNEGTIEDKIQEMGTEFNLEPEISDDLEDVTLSDTPQFAESDMNYITRISQKIGAVAKPVDEHLVIANEGSGKSVSGRSLPTKYIDASEVATYSCSFKETETSGLTTTGTVYANWYEKETGEYHLVHAGSGDPETELNEIFSSEKEALAAVQSKVQRVAKNNKTFRFSVEGRTDLFAESPLVLRGFNPKIPARWIISKVEHSLSSSGFTTSVDCVWSKNV